MKKAKDLVYSHWPAIVLASLIALLVAAPQVYFRIEHRDDGIYQGIELLPDSPWSARIREVQDGNPSFGSIYYSDGKSDPYLFQPLGSIVVGYLGKSLGLNINDTLLFSRLLLTPVVFLLMYAFVFFLSRERLVALCSAAVILLAEAILNPFGLAQVLKGVAPDDFLKIGRPLNPAMIYVFFFGYLVVFLRYFRERSWTWGIASAVLLGLNFYNYFYSWTYLYAFGGLLGLFYIVRKKWVDAASLAAIHIGALVVAIPYGINLYSATQYATYEDVGARFGVIESHAPLFVGAVVVAAIIAFILWFPRHDRERWFLGLALMLTPFVTLNQQIVTGKLLQEAHYHWFFHKPMAVIILFIIIFHFLCQPRFHVYKKFFALFVVGLSVAVGAFTQAYSYSHPVREGGEIAIERQKYGPVMKWLSNSAKENSVIFANDTTSHMTVIYTPHDVFYHRAAVYSLSASDTRLREVMFTFYRLQNTTGETARDIFFAERGHLSYNTYGMHYRELLGSYASIPDEKIEELIQQYQVTLEIPSSEWLFNVLEKYRVNYLIWDKIEDPSWAIGEYPFLKKAAIFGDIEIYQVIGRNE